MVLLAYKTDSPKPNGNNRTIPHHWGGFASKHPSPLFVHQFRHLSNRRWISRRFLRIESYTALALDRVPDNRGKARKYPTQGDRCHGRYCFEQTLWCTPDYGTILL